MDPWLLLAIALGAFVAVILIIVVIARYRVSSPDEAFIISGSKSKSGDTTVPSKVVLGGGGVFVVPFTQKLSRLSLETRQIAWTVHESPSAQNVLVSLEGVANVKVGGDEVSVRAAIERFNVNPSNIEKFTQQSLEGEMRAIVGTMTVEEINGDREALKERVLKLTGEVLSAQGLVLENLSIQSVTTPGGYITDLGRGQAAKARRDAEIAEAETKRESEEKRAKADEAIAEANRTLALRVAQIKQDTDTAEAQALAAGPIAKAQRDVEVYEQERLAEQKRAAVTEMRLESEVRKPADAKAYETKVTAEAERDAAIARATAEAETITRRGRANADAVRDRGLAEAEATKAKSAAFKDYPTAGLLEIAMDGLPAIVAEAAKPIGAIDNLTVVSTDGADQVTKMTAGVFSQTDETMKALAGFGVRDLLAGVIGGTAAGQVLASDKAKGGAVPPARKTTLPADGDSA